MSGFVECNPWNLELGSWNLDLKNLGASLRVGLYAASPRAAKKRRCGLYAPIPCAPSQASGGLPSFLNVHFYLRNRFCPSVTDISFQTRVFVHRSLTYPCIRPFSCTGDSHVEAYDHFRATVTHMLTHTTIFVHRSLTYPSEQLLLCIGH